MGFLKKLLGLQPPVFYPDFSLSEYDNWMNFLEAGGNSAQWETLKLINQWTFIEDPFEKYQEEIKPIADKYFPLMDKIEKNWSILYNSKNYQGKLSELMEQDCLIDIRYYEQMRSIDIKYNYSPPDKFNIPALKRLAMLYERQGKLEQSIEMCRKACSFGMDESSRIKKLLKKIGRTPTDEELQLINKFSQNE